MPENMNPMDQFNTEVLAKIEDTALEVLSTHPRNMLDAAIHAVNCVYVGSPEDDTPEVKKAMVIALLGDLAIALADAENPLDFEFMVDAGTDKYTGNVHYNITKAVAKEFLIPSAMLNRSRSNRVAKAAKKLTS